MSEQDETQEMVLVPRIPTKEMIDEAWPYALDEDAGAVWKSMIETWLSSKQRKVGEG